MTECDANALAVRFTAAGTSFVETGEGDALILVHGVGMNRAVWTPQIEAFASRYRVIAYDLLGHGESPLPSEGLQLAELTDQLIELLDDIGLDRVHLVGHSMGALIALDLALRMPERVHALVVLNGVCDRNEEQRAAVLQRARQFESGADDETVEQTLERWFGPGKDLVAPDRIAAVRRWLEAVDQRGYARVYGCFARADRELVERLPQLTMPTLFMTGEFDRNSTADMARRMASTAPCANAHVVSGQRHMMAFADPAGVNPLIADFLEDPSAPAERAADCIEQYRGQVQ